LLVSTITALCACGGAAAGEGSVTLPEAQGSVRAERHGDQLVLDIRVVPTAAPGELDPKATVYVAWAKPSRGGPARNLGALALRGDEGELHARTPAEEMSVIITAEPAAEVATPSGPTVLWAYVPRAGAAQAATAAPTTPTHRGATAAVDAGATEAAAPTGREPPARDAGDASPSATKAGDASAPHAVPGRPSGTGAAAPCDCDPRADSGVPCPDVQP
jgi:hypothetical protein